MWLPTSLAATLAVAGTIGEVLRSRRDDGAGEAPRLAFGGGAPAIAARLRGLRTRSSATATGTAVAFIHVPKCGGMSVDRALRSALGVTGRDGWIDPRISRDSARGHLGEGVPEQAVPRMLVLRRYLLAHYLTEGRRVVSGHGPVSEWILDRFAGRTPFVTLLRHPVERWISYYTASRLASEDPNIRPNRLSGLPLARELDETLRSPTGAYIASLGAIYLGGHVPYGDEDPLDAVEGAVASLRRFAVVGFSADWADFARQCRRHLGIAVRVPHLNATSSYGQTRLQASLSSLFTPEVRERITHLCRADLAIYKAARQARAGLGTGPAGPPHRRREPG